MLSKDDGLIISEILGGPSTFDITAEDLDKNEILRDFYEAIPERLKIDTRFNDATVEQVRDMYTAAMALAKKLHEAAEPYIDVYIATYKAGAEADDQYDEQVQEELEASDE